MSYNNYTLDIDGDGIALITWDMPGKSMNVLNLEAIEELGKIIERLETEDVIKGAVFTSGKAAFSGGADLKMLEGLLTTFHKERASNPDVAMQALFDGSRQFSQLLRRLETCGKPVVAAINGTALGGAFELALACHARFASDNDKTQLGLPEVKVGLFPGAGGTQRLPRMIPAADALQLLLRGSSLRVAKAKGMGILNDVVPAEDLIETSKAWIRNGGKGVQPWDAPKFRLPGGPVYSKAGMETFPPANAIYRRETYDNYPGARAIMKCVYEGLLVPLDTGLTIESRYFANVMQTTEAAHMIRSLFVSMQELNKGARRPEGIEPSTIKKVGVLGAGFMGAGIAYVTAKAGMNVVLLDRDMDAAEKGKDYSDKILSKALSRGRTTEDKKQAVLDLIQPSADYDDLKGCDLIIEAVFEDRDVKKAVTEAAEAVVGKNCVFASNTSTLPITSLAENSKRPANFIGIHFFSPVEKMMLVEVIMAKKTKDRALAVALDYIRAIRKTPIVVNDSRGFYTSRVVGTYIREGHLMLSEGVSAAMIENLGRMAGMPVGPLSLNDEVAVDLAWKILQATKKDQGADAIDPGQEKLLEAMVIQHGRLGRKNGKGFYDYPKNGPKRLWPGLADIMPVTVDPDTVDTEELQQRMLVIQALETARCFQEKVLTDVREADVGSILGFGFAPFSGGTLSYIDGMGAANFVTLCRKLARKHGPRFRPNRLLNQMAKNGETFYGRFGHGAKMDKAA